MRLLLDTHVLLWALGDVAELGATARAAIADGRNVVYVSAASVWEISIKRALGKLVAPAEIESVITKTGFRPLPITLAHAEQVATLPPLHADPFDRMLVAQAGLEGLTLATRDARLKGYDVSILDV